MTTMTVADDRVTLDCVDCSEMTKYVVSGSAFDFYLERYPGQPYRCPTHRLQRDPQAVLYGEWRQEEQERGR